MIAKAFNIRAVPFAFKAALNRERSRAFSFPAMLTWILCSSILDACLSIPRMMNPSRSPRSIAGDDGKSEAMDFGPSESPQPHLQRVDNLFTF